MIRFASEKSVRITLPADFTFFGAGPLGPSFINSDLLTQKFTRIATESAKPAIESTTRLCIFGDE